MKRTKPTRKQREVLQMRYEQGATIDRIAAWLRISVRAVYYRLQNAQKVMARHRSAQAQSGKANILPKKLRKRSYTASQIAAESKSATLNLDDV
jgi:predicted DNA-binding protein YlxM (UPF0122 family)